MSKPSTHAIDPELGEQLSALMDGELDAERSRFLLRRLEGDPALRAAWERWQLVSGSLKGRLALQVDAGFLARVRDGIEAGRHADEPMAEVGEDGAGHAPAPAPAAVWLRWAAGGAIAASVAVVAVMATQPQAPVAEPGQGLVEATPAEPYIVAPSPLSEADLRPRLRRPPRRSRCSSAGPCCRRRAECRRSIRGSRPTWSSWMGACRAVASATSCPMSRPPKVASRRSPSNSRPTEPVVGPGRL